MRGTWGGVFFDLDGTLADTVDLILRCFRHTSRVHLGEALPDEVVISTIGTPLPVQMRGFARSDEEAERMRQTYVEFQEGVHDDMVRAFPGAASVLATLRDRGTKLAVVTSKHTRIAHLTIECCGLSDSLDLVVCADQVKRPKPEPESVVRALDHFGLRADEVLFVGDSPFDLQAGRSAGVRTAAALWGPFPHHALTAEEPDFLLQGLEDVLTLTPD